MKRALILSTLLTTLGCAHSPSGSARQPWRGNGVEFLFLPPDPERGLMGLIPISTHGICGDKGVFAEAFLSLVVESVSADGQSVTPDKRGGVYDGPPVGALVIRPDQGFTYQVSQRDLEANVFEWSEKSPPPGFVPPSHGPVRTNSFHIEADKDSPLEVVINYRIRCADMTMSATLSTRGQNLAALAWRSVARPANKPLQLRGAAVKSYRIEAPTWRRPCC